MPRLICFVVALPSLTYSMVEPPPLHNRSDAEAADPQAGADVSVALIPAEHGEDATLQVGL